MFLRSNIEVGFYREDAGHTEFCDVLEYLKGVGFQFFALYDQDSIVFVAHPVQPRFPWSNALFLRNDLVAQKYEAQYARWLAGLSRRSRRSRGREGHTVMLVAYQFRAE